MNENQDIFNTVTSKAKEFALSEKEKATLFRAIDLHVSKNPIKKASRFNDIRWWSYISTHYSQAMSFALVLFVILGTSTSYAAQRSLPGDLLYAFKVGVNEQLRSLVLTDMKKTAFEASRAAERLKEAQILAIRGELTPTLKAKIESEFDAHIAAVEKKTVEYTEKGEYSKALAVTNSLEVALHTQEEGAEQTTFSEKVQATLQSSLVARIKTENSIVAAATSTEDIRKVAEDRQAVASQLIAQVTEKMPPAVEAGDTIATFSATMAPAGATSKAKIAADAPVEEVVVDPAADARMLLARAAELMNMGDEAKTAGRYNEAFGWYRQAQSLAAEAQVIIDLNDTADTPDSIDENFE